MGDFEIREIRTPQGPKKLNREREEYFRLMDQGFSSSEACRIVGINRWTGKRWRNGRAPNKSVRKGAPPVRRPTVLPSDASRYLREDERIYIADRGVGEGADPGDRASSAARPPPSAGRSAATGTPPTASTGRTRPRPAPRPADPRPKPSKIGQNPELRAYIQAHLHQRWSPEQIVQSLHRTFPERPEMHVCRETIHQAHYAQGRGEQRREPTRALRTGRAMRKPRRLAQQRYSTPMVMISKRPAGGRRPRRARPLGMVTASSARTAARRSALWSGALPAT